MSSRFVSIKKKPVVRKRAAKDFSGLPTRRQLMLMRLSTEEYIKLVNKKWNLK